MKIRVCLVATIFVGTIILYALYRKGDVKAGLRVFGLEFSLEAKDPTDNKTAQPTKPAPIHTEESPALLVSGH